VSGARRVTAAFALLALLLPQALGREVADLTIVSYGAQLFDLFTGFTELPDGGEIVDRTSGVRLVAPWLRYAEGRELEARDAVVEAPFGRLEAPEVRIDLARSRLEASGGVRLEIEEGRTLRAERLRYDPLDGWAYAAGDVESADPRLTAAAVWADTVTGRFVLEAPYAYFDGPLVLRADEPGTRLQLTPVVAVDGSVVGYDASTTLAPDVLERLAAGLE